MRQFCIIVTREGRLRLKFLKLEHGLLHDKTEKKTYAIVRDAYPTNWAGRWSRAYVVYERDAQTIQLGSTQGEARETDGGTVEVIEPLNMVAKIRMPSPRGEDGQLRDVHLTAESIYDRTLSVQVRRLGNRRFQWFHALAFIAVGFVIGVFASGIIALMAGSDAPDADPAPDIVIPSGPQSAPQSGPAPEPTIRVGATPLPRNPTEGPHRFGAPSPGTARAPRRQELVCSPRTARHAAPPPGRSGTMTASCSSTHTGPRENSSA